MVIEIGRAVEFVRWNPYQRNVLLFRFIRFYGSSGLLKSKIDESGSYLYEYDIYGRLVKAILPTGQAIGLQFNLTSQGEASIFLKNQRKSLENSESLGS